MEPTHFMIHPFKDSIPAWYELTLVNPTTLGFRIHTTALLDLARLPWGSITSGILADPFTPPCEGDCGLNKIFTFTESENPDWILWQCPLPTAYDNGNKGHDLFATMSLFFGSLSLMYSEVKSHCPYSQLILLEDIYFHQQGGSFKLTLTAPTVKWLHNHGDQTFLDEVSAAMRSANMHIWNQGRSGTSGFQAVLHEKRWLHLVTGVSGGLDPAPNSSNNPDSGYEMVCHNVSTWTSALPLIVGVAKMHDLIRRCP